VNYIHEILHDVSGGSGFLEVSTRFHKSARSAQQKALLLPIVMSSAGVVDMPWIHSWIANRKSCGLPTSGLAQGALMPAPCMGDRVSWLKRPLSPGEVTNTLKGFLQCEDPGPVESQLESNDIELGVKGRGAQRASQDSRAPFISCAVCRFILQQRYEHWSCKCAAEGN
jgi:hypothetical protein